MSAPEQTPPTNSRYVLFEPTPWSVVLAAGKARTDSQSMALQRLCDVYWPPLYAYARQRVKDEHLAQDLTQSFFVRLLCGSTLKQADPARGRFRSYLLQAFDWHVANEFRESNAIKRGGQSEVLVLDFSKCQELADANSLTPEQIFERQWAMTLLNQAMLRLRAEQVDAQKLEQFEKLRFFLNGDRPTGGYAKVCFELGMNEPAARMAVCRLRSRFRELLKAEILTTVASQEDVNDEIAHLFNVLSQTC